MDRTTWLAEELQLKELGSDAGLVCSYAAIYNSVDNGSDRFIPGVFTKSLGERASQIVYIPSHDHGVHVSQIPAVPQIVREDSRGLYTESKFFLNTQAGKDSFTVLKAYHEAGRPMGLSVAYKPTTVDFENKSGVRVRNIKEAKLFEYGHTAIPMNDETRDMKVKSFDGDVFFKAYYSEQERQHLSSMGHAMPDGSFPIATVEDLHNAIHLVGMGHNPEGAKSFIIKRAQELGLSDELPTGWMAKSKKSEDELWVECKQWMDLLTETKNGGQLDEAQLRSAQEAVATLQGLLTPAADAQAVARFAAMRQRMDF